MIIEVLFFTRSNTCVLDARKKDHAISSLHYSLKTFFLAFMVRLCGDGKGKIKSTSAFSSKG